MRRRPVLQRVDEESELFLRLFARHAEESEDLVLNLRIVDSDRAAPRLEPVEDEKADMLVNPNINQSNAEIDAETGEDYGEYDDYGGAP